MAVEWYFLKEDRSEGPISESQLRAFAKEGTILPRTPVCRVSDGKRSPWGHAGEIQGLFPEQMKLDLGPPICPNCGRASPNGECPTCGLMFPPPFPSEAGSPSQTPPQPNEYSPKVLDFLLELPNRLQEFLKGWFKSDDSLRGETWPQVKPTDDSSTLNKRLWIRRSDNKAIWGPFPRSSLAEDIRTGQIMRDDEALEEKGQSFSDLKSSTEWVPLRSILPPDAFSIRKPRIPSESDHCFILCEGERSGPYLLSQIRTMWKSGKITADSTIIWGDNKDPIPVATLLRDSRSSRVGEYEHLGEIGTGVLVVSLVALLYFASGFDTAPWGTHNIGLLQDQRNGILVSCFFAALGFIAIMFGRHGGGKK